MFFFIPVLCAPVGEAGTLNSTLIYCEFQEKLVCLCWTENKDHLEVKGRGRGPVGHPERENPPQFINPPWVQTCVRLWDHQEMGQKWTQCEKSSPSRRKAGLTVFLRAGHAWALWKEKGPWETVSLDLRGQAGEPEGLPVVRDRCKISVALEAVKPIFLFVCLFWISIKSKHRNVTFSSNS